MARIMELKNITSLTTLLKIAASEEEIDTIVKTLQKAKQDYYTTSTSSLSDAEFDQLEDRLRQLDPNNSYFEEVGAIIPEGKIQHVTKMRSLSKVKTPEKLDQWLKKRFIGQPVDVITEPKIDGVSLTIKYNNGTAQYAATRGKGDIGSDVSYLIDAVEDIPKTVPIEEEFEIRGECYLPRDTKYAVEKEQKSLRNIAAGIINRKNGREAAKYLKFVAYDVIDLPFSSEDEKMEFLKKVTPNPVIYEKATSIEGIQSIYEEYLESRREVINYDIDGLVIKINDTNLQQQVEIEHPHHPNWAVAYKFPPEQTESILQDIIWQIGEKGKETPVAIIEPVVLGGRTISKATLHNQKRIDTLQLEIGDSILVGLLGDVIPGILANLSKNIYL